jgi:hypothetical protein
MKRTPKTKPKAKPKPPSIAEALLAAGGSPKGFTFTAAMIAEIEECRAVNKSGRGYISVTLLARALREKYKLVIGESALRQRIAALAPGGRWT